MGLPDSSLTQIAPVLYTRDMRFHKKLLLLMLAMGASVCSMLAQDPLQAYPKNYRLILDNDLVSVIRVHYGPHEKVGVHDHSSYPTIYVYLNNSGPVHFVHDEKPPFEITRPPSVKGAFRVSPGRIERHSVQNLSDLSSDFLRVELKKIPLNSGLHEFRGKAPASLSVIYNVDEFKSPAFDIERVICPSCEVNTGGVPSLYIAFSPLKLNGHLLKDGDVLWIPDAEMTSVAAASDAPAHLLRIAMKAK